MKTIRRQVYERKRINKSRRKWTQSFRGYHAHYGEDSRKVFGRASFHSKGRRARRRGVWAVFATTTHEPVLAA